MKKLFFEGLKILGEFGVMSGLVTILLIIWVSIPPDPIVSVNYHGQDEVQAEDVRAVLVWDKAQGDYAPVENPQEWFTSYRGGYKVSYDAPDFRSDD